MSYAQYKEDFNLLPKGEYEVTLTKFETVTLDSGAKKLESWYEIRKDVDQKYKGRLVFDDIWKEKESDFYNRKRIGKMLSAITLPADAKLETTEDVLPLLRGQSMIIGVNIGMDEYYQQEVNYISYFKKSANPIPQAEALPF